MSLYSSNMPSGISIVAAVLALVLTVLAFIFIVPEKRREKMKGFGRFLHDTVNFKYLVVEKILQAFYIFSTVLVILTGFFMLFITVDSYWGDSQWLGGYGLLVMIVGPIVLRLVYELLMMGILLVKNVISINKKLGAKNGEQDAASPFADPDLSGMGFQRPAQADSNTAPESNTQSAGFCPECGAPLDGNPYCPQCGTKVR